MNENVMVIPAKKIIGSRVSKTKDQPKLKAAAYCRVSTDSDEQEESYKTQVEHYSKVIGSNPDYEFAGVYADEGISGLSLKKRDEFNRMIDDCLNGKIDVIFCKSISRFSRNTVDCLKHVRLLKEKNIQIVFEKEGIKTLEQSGELFLTVMASLAQQESESLSKNVKLGLQFRYQAGVVNVNYNKFLGYTKNDEGKLVIVPEEAEVVKRIYKEFLEGKGFSDICEGLENDGIETGAHKKKWHESTILKILQNEKYIGDALLQKTITTNLMEKKRIVNDGSEAQYYVSDCIDPIISRDIYALVQQELVRRSKLLSDGTKKRIYSSKYALSSICKCGKCGDLYQRIKWNNRGKKSTVWRCANRRENGPSACNSPTILEDELKDAIVVALNDFLSIDEKTRKTIESGILEAISENNEKLDKLNKTLKKKQQELINLANSNKDYGKIAEEIEKLKAQKQELLVKDAQKSMEKTKLGELETLINIRKAPIKEYDEDLCRKYVERVTIDDEYVTVRLKSGVEKRVLRKIC